MAGILTKGLLAAFPAQKKRFSEKTKKWYIKCIDAGHSLAEWENDSGVRANIKEKISNYNLYNDIVDPKEVEAVINPYRIEAEFINEYRNFPLANPNINVLLGEERKRIFNPIITSINSDAVSKKMRDLTEIFNEMIQDNVLSEEFNEDKVRQEIQEFDKWAKFDYRDHREKMANQIIKYGFMTNDFKEIFSRCFEDLLLSGEEIIETDILGGKPVLRKLNPINTYTLRSGDSWKIEDSDIIVTTGYLPVGQVIDDYYDELKSNQIKLLEEAYTTSIGEGRLFKDQLIYKPINLQSYIDQVGIDGVITATGKDRTYYGGSFDDDGNVRVTKVRWKGLRRIGILKYFDDNGDIQKRYIDEDYPIDKDAGEDVEWKWVSEWYEGTRIADDIYVKMGPRPVQFRTKDNPSECHPGIVGSVFNINSSKAKSLMSMMKPYQLMYNFFMHKLREYVIRYKGDIAKLNTTMIPDGWGMDKWLFYMDQMGIAFEDPFNEGKKGVAMGKLAGSYNTSSGTVRIGDANIIQQTLLILDFLERRLQDISGITPQRKGAVENRETLGGVERAVNQSSHITEKYFAMHDNFRVRALRAYLETAKVAWKNNKFKTQFMMDDGSIGVLDFDGEMFKESEYGIDITTASTDMQAMQALQSLSQAFVQNGGTLSMVAELYRTKDPTSLQRKLEAFEENLRAQQEQQQQQQIESAERINQQQIEAAAAQEQAKTDLENRKLDVEVEKNIRDNETKLAIAELSNQGDGIDEAKLELERDKAEADMDHKDRQLQETMRKNDMDADMKKRQINSKATTK